MIECFAEELVAQFARGLASFCADGRHSQCRVHQPGEALPATSELIGGHIHIAHRCTVRSRCLLQQRSPSVRLWQQQAVVLVANAHLAT